MRGLQIALLITFIPISLQENDHTASFAGSTGPTSQTVPNFLGLKLRQRNGILNIKSQIQAAKFTTAFVNPICKYARNSERAAERVLVKLTPPFNFLMQMATCVMPLIFHVTLSS